MSKDLFMQMREAEIMTINFLPTKKEITTSAKAFALKMVNSGENNLFEKFAQALRMKEALNIIEAELKASLPQENFEEFGLKGTYRSGGAVCNYNEDEDWAKLKSQLSHRESLLKLASSSDIEIYDENGILVPKVGKTERKSSLAITF